MAGQVAKEILEKWREGFRKEDAESLASLFAEKASFKDPRFPKLHGVETIREYYECLLADAGEWESFLFEGPYMYNEDCFSIRTNLRFTWRENGVRAGIPFVAFFKVNTDGQIVRYEEYWDCTDALTQIGIDSWVAYEYI